MMGISARVMDEHYDRAGQVAAATVIDKLITQLQAEAVARQGYNQRGRRRPPVKDAEGTP